MYCCGGPDLGVVPLLTGSYGHRYLRTQSGENRVSARMKKGSKWNTGQSKRIHLTMYSLGICYNQGIKQGENLYPFLFLCLLCNGFSNFWMLFLLFCEQYRPFWCFSVSCILIRQVRAVLKLNFFLRFIHQSHRFC